MSERLLTTTGLHTGYDGVAVVRDLTMHVDAGEVVAWCRAVGEALNSQQLAAHDAVKHAHHQVLRAASFFPARQARTQSIRLGRR